MTTIKYKLFNLFMLLTLFLFVGCGDKKSKDAAAEGGDVTAIYEVTSLTNHEFVFNGN